MSFVYLFCIQPGTGFIGNTRHSMNIYNIKLQNVHCLNKTLLYISMKSGKNLNLKTHTSFDKPSKSLPIFQKTSVVHSFQVFPI